MTHFKCKQVSPSIPPPFSSFLLSHLSALSLSYNTLHFNYSFDSFAALTHSIHFHSLRLANQNSRYDLSSSLCACSLSAFSASLAPVWCGACNTCSWQAARTDPGPSRSILLPILASFSAASAESYSSLCGARQKFVSICKTFSLCARRGKFHIF